MAQHETNKRCRNARISSNNPCGSMSAPCATVGGPAGRACRKSLRSQGGPVLDTSVNSSGPPAAAAAVAAIPISSEKGTCSSHPTKTRPSRGRTHHGSSPSRLPVIISAGLPYWTATCPAGRSPAEGGSLSCRRRPRGLMYDEGGSAAGEETEEESVELEERSSMFLSGADSEDDEDNHELELMDLPDNALATCFFSGFLDSIKVVSCLQLVSKRITAIGSDSCKTLDLHGTRICDEELGKVTAAFPHIIDLDLSYCKGIGRGVGASLRPCMDSLRTLSLRGTGASDEMVEGLRDFRHLTELDLCQSLPADSTKITPRGLEVLMGMKRLEKLGLAWNKGVTDEAVEKLCGALSGLRELDLALCNKITSRALKALSLQHNLRMLSVQACSLINDDGVEVLTSSCPGLVTLDLAHLPLITASALNSLRRLRGLRKLDVRCCEEISKADVARFKAARSHTWVAELRSWWP